MSHVETFDFNPAQPVQENAAGLWLRHPDVIARKVAGEFVLVPLRQAHVDMQAMYTLNPVGAFLWNELKIGQTEPALVTSLLTHYVVSFEQAQTDVSDFLTQLKIRDLILYQPNSAKVE